MDSLGKIFEGNRLYKNTTFCKIVLVKSPDQGSVCPPAVELQHPSARHVSHTIALSPTVIFIDIVKSATEV